MFAPTGFKWEKDPLITVGGSLQRCQSNLMKPQPHSPDEGAVECQREGFLETVLIRSVSDNIDAKGSFSATQRVFINVLSRSFLRFAPERLCDYTYGGKQRKRIGGKSSK